MSEKLRVLDLFSGIGGFSLGLERTGGFETVAFCEIEEFPRKVLAKHWPHVPIHEDVRELTADAVGPVDIVVGGYPCQPFSTAGKRSGAEDGRHLWPEMHRLVASIRPAWVCAENVAGHISLGLDQVLSDLEAEGYTGWPLVIPACAVDAPHRRDRVWIIAHDDREHRGADERKPDTRTNRRDDTSGVRTVVPNASDVLQPNRLERRGYSSAAGASEGGDKREGQTSHGQRVRTEPGASCEALADAGHAGILQQGQYGDGCKISDKQIGVRRDVLSGQSQREVLADANSPRLSDSRGGQESAECDGLRAANHTSSGGRGFAKWSLEPDVGRVAHGVPSRVDRLKCLGNAVVPQIPEMIGYAILEAERAAAA